MGDSKASSMFGAGSAVLRGVITAPLERVRKQGFGPSGKSPHRIRSMPSSRGRN